MRIVVFGANGPTGRELIGQALAAGHQTTAVTRHPEQIAPRERLAVAGADATDAEAVSAAVAGSDAVLSALGVPYTRNPVTVYSTGTANIMAAMQDHGVRRLVVTSSAALDPAYRSTDSVLFRHVMEPLFMRLPGKTVYADNDRMEALIRASGLEWTIVRACWLFNAPQISGYRICEGSIRGMFTARADLAAFLLAQLADDRFVRKAVGLVTTAGTPSIVQQVWREGVKKEKKN
jgi:putative NADH-flavin reductase